MFPFGLPANDFLMILILALAIDLVFGEYPAGIHPVVWTGKFAGVLLRLAPSASWYRQLLFGAALTFTVASVSAILAWLILEAASPYPVVQILVGAFLLKSSFALKELGAAAMRVVHLVEMDKLHEARTALGALCSRDADELSGEELLGATIESLAENASDSFVAPLFYFMLLGVPGAVGYRAINTLDAMIGYRGEYEALGKFAARLDDLANLIPARLTALLFLLTGWIWGGSIVQGRRILFRDGGKTPSPNGGRPMAAMAGMLKVQLNKRGVYSLGDACAALKPAKVRQAWRIVLGAGAGMALACGFLLT